MTETQLDMAAISAAAADALAAPNDVAMPLLPAALLCETGCGRPLNIVLTWVADSETRILCDVCALLMFMKIAQDMEPAGPVDETGPAPDDEGRTATQAPAPE